MLSIQPPDDSETFMNYQRHWLEEHSGSDDSHGRTLLALGTVLGRFNTPALHSMAGWMFEQALPAIRETTSPRAWAFALIGIHEYLRRFSGDRNASQFREELANARLMGLYIVPIDLDDWKWFEDELTYCNAALPHAMLICGHMMANEELTAVGLESLNGWQIFNGLMEAKATLCRLDLMGSTSAAELALVLTSNPLKRKLWCLRALKHIAQPVTSVGVMKRGAPSSGFWDEMT